MRHWWEDAVFYQIYPRSFADSGSDGIGDIAGITGKLGYLRDLGVDALWLSPFFRSPMKDFGYDVSDYRDVDPMFGTLDDLKELLAKAKALRLRVVLDLVANHSSDEHPWFVEARSSKEAAKHGWYLRVPDTGKLPNNWKAVSSLAPPGIKTPRPANAISAPSRNTSRNSIGGRRRSARPSTKSCATGMPSVSTDSASTSLRHT